VPDHPVLLAATAGDPVHVLEDEAEIRRASVLPPFSALAVVSGTLAATYVEALRSVVSADPRVSVIPLEESRFLVQAPDHRELCDVLAGTPRPAGRGLRVEVDPADL
jgi:primosomal protein N'